MTVKLPSSFVPSPAGLPTHIQIRMLQRNPNPLGLLIALSLWEKRWRMRSNSLVFRVRHLIPHLTSSGLLSPLLSRNSTPRLTLWLSNGSYNTHRHPTHESCNQVLICYSILPLFLKFKITTQHHGDRPQQMEALKLLKVE